MLYPCCGTGHYVCFYQKVWEDLNLEWECVGEKIFTDYVWYYVMGGTDTFDVKDYYKYDGFEEIHDDVIKTLTNFFLPYTRRISDLLGTMWSDQRDIDFSNDLYNRVNIE